MSSRRPTDTTSIDAKQLRMELEQLKAANTQIVAETPSSPKSVDATPATDGLSFADLTPTEQAAGSLGVHPSAWKPISFMNNAHYENLIKGNAVSEDLARRIEAFKHVSAQ